MSDYNEEISEEIVSVQEEKIQVKPKKPRTEKQQQAFARMLERKKEVDAVKKPYTALVKAENDIKKKRQ